MAVNGKRGIDALRDPATNKSTAFTEAEREGLGLTGLLPSGIDSQEAQVQRVLQHLGAKPTDLERYIYLIGLLDTDETLFYRVLMSDPAPAAFHRHREPLVVLGAPRHPAQEDT
jgi:malate dehydrogenase (oxaloacetate-decarboxylating)(NADP+)